MLLWLLASTVLTVSGFLIQLLGNYVFRETAGIQQFVVLIRASIPQSDSCMFWSLGMPFSKPLYTVSYMLLTGGVSGFLLLLLYYIVSLSARTISGNRTVG